MRFTVSGMTYDSCSIYFSFKSTFWKGFENTGQKNKRIQFENLKMHRFNKKKTEPSRNYSKSGI